MRKKDRFASPSLPLSLSPSLSIELHRHRALRTAARGNTAPAPAALPAEGEGSAFWPLLASSARLEVAGRLEMGSPARFIATRQACSCPQRRTAARRTPDWSQAAIEGEGWCSGGIFDACGRSACGTPFCSPPRIGSSMVKSHRRVRGVGGAADAWSVGNGRGKEDGNTGKKRANE